MIHLEISQVLIVISINTEVACEIQTPEYYMKNIICGWLGIASGNFINNSIVLKYLLPLKYYTYISCEIS